MTWADLDKLSIAKPRSDGATTIVVQDERSLRHMVLTEPLSIIVAIARVVRGRRLLAERFGSRGKVVYLTTRTPPDFVTAAVTAAGGVVFDGKREHVAEAPLATTMQLDAAFLDLATRVRRRMDETSFDGALETFEHDLHHERPDRSDGSAWWTAIIELSALAGEIVREGRGARWIETPAERFPLGLDLGKSHVVYPAKLAQTIVEGGGVSMREMLDALEIVTMPGSELHGTEMPMLCDRHARSLENVTWEPLLPDGLDGDEVPIVAYVLDRGGTIEWRFGPTELTPDRRVRARSNVARRHVELTPMNLPDGNKLVIVSGGPYAAESLLVPATMEQVRAELGGPKMLLLAVPARGQLLAIDGEIGMLDDELQRSFRSVVDDQYVEAAASDRITRAVLLYTDRPIGRLHPNASDPHRATSSDA